MEYKKVRVKILEIWRNIQYGRESKEKKRWEGELKERTEGQIIICRKSGSTEKCRKTFFNIRDICSFFSANISLSLSLFVLSLSSSIWQSLHLDIIRNSRHWPSSFRTFPRSLYSLQISHPLTNTKNMKERKNNIRTWRENPRSLAQTSFILLSLLVITILCRSQRTVLSQLTLPVIITILLSSLVPLPTSPSPDNSHLPPFSLRR